MAANPRKVEIVGLVLGNEVNGFRKITEGQVKVSTAGDGYSFRQSIRQQAETLLALANTIHPSVLTFTPGAAATITVGLPNGAAANARLATANTLVVDDAAATAITAAAILAPAAGAAGGGVGDQFLTAAQGEHAKRVKVAAAIAIEAARAYITSAGGAARLAPAGNVDFNDLDVIRVVANRRATGPDPGLPPVVGGANFEVNLVSLFDNLLAGATHAGGAVAPGAALPVYTAAPPNPYVQVANLYGANAINGLGAAPVVAPAAGGANAGGAAQTKAALAAHFANFAQRLMNHAMKNPGAATGVARGRRDVPSMIGGSRYSGIGGALEDAPSGETKTILNEISDPLPSGEPVPAVGGRRKNRTASARKSKKRSTRKSRS